MTRDEFQKKYHNYMTKNGGEAKKEADKANKEGIEKDEAIAINFGNLGWALMLKSAAIFAALNKLIPPQEQK